MSIERIATANGEILCDSDRLGRKTADLPSDRMFDAAYWEGRKKIVARSTAGRGGVLFVRDDRYYWALRHYRRGGFVGKLIADSYLWTGAQRTRAFAEFHLLHTLRAQGLPVPIPVAARYVRSGVWYRADLITEVLPAARPLSDAIAGARLTEESWRNIGAVIGKFHAAGVQHADLNAHNILLGESGKAFVLDFDRGRIRARGSWEQGVLRRLRRSLDKIRRERANVQFTERDWQALLAGVGNSPDSRRSVP